MTQKNQKSKTKLSEKDRLVDARKWLRRQNHPNNKLIELYMKRYGINESIAIIELMTLGYRDELTIAQYEKDNIEWKYMVEPPSGEMLVVPEETQEHELYTSDIY